MQDTRSNHDSRNLPKIDFIAFICILYYQSSIKFQFSPNLPGFPDILNLIRHNVGFGTAKTPKISALNVMAMRVKRHANVSKQAMLLDGLDVSPLKWRVCGCGLNRCVHEGMNHILNVEVNLKTRSRNVNINIIWFMGGDLNGFFSRFKSFYEVKGVGHVIGDILFSVIECFLS